MWSFKTSIGESAHGADWLAWISVPPGVTVDLALERIESACARVGASYDGWEAGPGDAPALRVPWGRRGGAAHPIENCTATRITMSRSATGICVWAAGAGIAAFTASNTGPTGVAWSLTLSGAPSRMPAASAIA